MLLAIAAQHLKNFLFPNFHDHMVADGAHMPWKLTGLQRESSPAACERRIFYENKR
jgi:hypothetical protein